MKMCSSQRIGVKKDVKLLKKTFIEGKSKSEKVGEDLNLWCRIAFKLGAEPLWGEQYI